MLAIKESLTIEDIEECKTKVEAFLQSRDPSDQIILSYLSI